MGNLFTKCYKFNDKDNDLFENLVNNLDGDLDYDTNIEIFETDIKNTKQLEYFNNNIIKTVSNLQKKIDTIEKNINYKYEEDKNSNQNSIYTINEQINLIHKDLKSLMENDKILIEKYDEINRETEIKTEISNNLIPNLN
tara:strand:+ start:127 stop:546 length:420 start_codon:yes stop_codon:yes gene_type:complete